MKERERMTKGRKDGSFIINWRNEEKSVKKTKTKSSALLSVVDKEVNIFSESTWHIKKQEDAHGF